MIKHREVTENGNISWLKNSFGIVQELHKIHKGKFDYKQLSEQYCSAWPQLHFSETVHSEDIFIGSVNRQIQCQM